MCIILNSANSAGDQLASRRAQTPSEGRERPVRTNTIEKHWRAQSLENLIIYENPLSLDEGKRTALMEAAAGGYTDVVAALLEYNVKLDTQVQADTGYIR